MGVGRAARPRSDEAIDDETAVDRDSRRCEYRRADGSLCKGWQTKDGAHCAGHAGLGFGGSPADASRIGAARSAEVRHQQAEMRQERRESAVRSTKEALALAAEELRGEIV